MSLRKKFSIETIDFVNPTDFPIGIVKDTYIDQGTNTAGIPPGWDDHNTWNFGGDAIFKVGVASNYYSLTGGVHYYHIVLEVQMPEKSDILGMDEIIKTELVLTTAGSSWVDANYIIMGIVAIDDNFDEGTFLGSFGFCNWEKFIDSVPWTRGDGASASRGNIDEKDGLVYDTVRLNPPIPSNIPVSFDITEAITFGDKKRFVIFVIDADVSGSLGQNDVATISFCSKEHSLVTVRPKLRVTYQDFAVEAFTDKDSALSIEPYTNNKEFPLLKWGGVTDEDFVNFKLYRSTSPITSVALLSPIATITSPESQEYVDTTIPTDGSGDGITYYYLVIAEDSYNTGDNAAKSANVSFKKPNISTFTFTPSGSQNVGISITSTIGSSVNIKKLYMDWKDSSTSWYTFETVGVSKSVSHVYSGKLSVTSLSARIECEKGYWSSLKNSVGTLSIIDTTPSAILIARPLKLVTGEVVYLNASLSHPAANNETITEYRYYNGSTWTGWLINDPFHSFIAGSPGTIGVRCEVKTSGGLTDVSETTNIEIVSNVAVPLVFSRDTKITSRIEKRDVRLSTSPIQGGVGEVDVQSGVSNIEITISGISSKVNLNDDLTIIREAVEDYTYVSIRVYDEICGSLITYEGRLVDYSITKTSQRHASWNCRMRVVKKV